MYVYIYIYVYIYVYTIYTHYIYLCTQHTFLRPKERCCLKKSLEMRGKRISENFGMPMSARALKELGQFVWPDADDDDGDDSDFVDILGNRGILGPSSVVTPALDLDSAFDAVHHHLPCPSRFSLHCPPDVVTRH